MVNSAGHENPRYYYYYDYYYYFAHYYYYCYYYYYGLPPRTHFDNCSRLPTASRRRWTPGQILARSWIREL